MHKSLGPIFSWASMVHALIPVLRKWGEKFKVTLLYSEVKGI